MKPIYPDILWELISKREFNKYKRKNPLCEDTSQTKYGVTRYYDGDTEVLAETHDKKPLFRVRKEWAATKKATK